MKKKLVKKLRMSRLERWMAAEQHLSQQAV
jgi:hypothetical protein